MVENAIAEGILVDNVNNATIDGNAASNDDQGARTDDYYAQCTTGREDCDGGIHLLGSSGSSVKGNQISHDASGIVISHETGPAADNTFSGNTATNDATAGGVILSAPGCRGPCR